MVSIAGDYKRQRNNEKYDGVSEFSLKKLQISHLLIHGDVCERRGLGRGEYRPLSTYASFMQKVVHNPYFNCYYS